MTKREKCAAAGRYVRQIQREHLREVMREMRAALEGIIKRQDVPSMFQLPNNSKEIIQARKALEAARRLGL